MSNRELLEGALKRVNARLGVNGKLYKDNTGWFVIWNVMYLSKDSMSASELLAYLHGVEDCFSYLNINKE